MARVIHLLRADTPRDALAQLALLGGPDERVFSLGPPPSWGEFPWPIRAVHCAPGPAWLTARQIAKAAGGAEIIHAWSPGVLRAAWALGSRAGLGVLLSLPYVPEAAVTARLAGAAQAGRLHLTAPTAAAASSLKAAGAPAGTVHLLPPPARCVEDLDARRRRTREALGVGEDWLVTAPTEMVRHARHDCAVWAYAICRYAGCRLRLLLPGTGPHERYVRRFAHTTELGGEILFPGDRLSRADLWAAADASIFLHDRDVGVADLAAALAAGLPVVASRLPDLLECAGEAAVLCEPAEPRPAAAALMRLIEEPPLRRRLSELAQARAGEAFAVPASRAALGTVYASAACGVRSP